MLSAQFQLVCITNGKVKDPCLFVTSFQLTTSPESYCAVIPYTASTMAPPNVIVWESEKGLLAGTKDALYGWVYTLSQISFSKVLANGRRHYIVYITSAIGYSLAKVQNILPNLPFAQRRKHVLCKRLNILLEAMEYPVQTRSIPFSLMPCFLNTLRPRQNGRRLADNICERIFLNGNILISINISLNVVPRGQINNIPALVQIIAWRGTGDKLLSEPMLIILLTHICVTRPQWVKSESCQ